MSYTKSFGTITTLLGVDFRLCESTITRTDCIEDLEVFIVSKLHFPHHVDYVLEFSHAVSLLGLIMTVHFSYFLSAEPLILYCTLSLCQNIPLIFGIPVLLLMPVSLNASGGSSYVFFFVFFLSLGIKLR